MLQNLCRLVAIGLRRTAASWVVQRALVLRSTYAHTNRAMRVDGLTLRVQQLILRPPEQLGAVTVFRNEGQSTTAKFRRATVCFDLRRRYRLEQLRGQAVRALRVLQPELPLRLLHQELGSHPRSSAVRRRDRL